MDLAAFNASLAHPAAPPALTPPLRALWHLARGEWEAAHAIAQSQEGERRHDWVHAHLHRVEGDEWNAGYWYRRAGKPVPEAPIEAERAAMIESLLSEM
ncbi:hypothetical protein IAI18_06365 [Acetobacteraceae bacterium H6797]|nr:hypothetical protein [Acetobacteraceae bacterium H6797]